MNTHLFSEPGKSDWRRDATLAAIWGVATWIVEVAVLPIQSMGIKGLSTWFGMSSTVFVQWFATGIGMAYCVMWAERGFRPLRLAVALALALGWGLLISLFAVPMACRLGFSRSSLAFFPGLTNPCDIHAYEALGTWAYVTWEMLLIAATFTPVYVLSARSERTRSMLARAEIARRQSEKAVEQAQLLALQRQVDPELLSHVMGVIQDRYGHDPVAADRLLDRLVSLLRTLMPGLRSNTSALDAELAILRAHAQLQDELHPGTGQWRIESPDMAGEQALPFPPLLMLSTIEAISGESVPRPAWSVAVRQQGAGLCIEIQVQRAAEPPLLHALKQRLLPALRGTWGPEAGLDMAVDAVRNLTRVTVHSRALAQPAPWAAPTSPRPKAPQGAPVPIH